MSASSKAQHRVDSAVVWFGLVASYLSLGGTQYSVAAGVAFAALALVVCRGIVPSVSALVPLLLAAAGAYPFSRALLFTVLLLLGPFLFRVLIGLVAAAAHILTTSEAGMDRIAAFQVVESPLWWGLCLSCAAVAVLEIGALGLVAVGLPALLIWRKHLLAAAAVALAAGALSGWSAAPLVLAGVIAAVLAWRLSARSPRLWHPLPAVDWRREPLTWIRIRRCDRRIRRGDLLRARRTVESVAAPTAHDLLRLAFLDVEERSYQRALSLTLGCDDPAGELEACATLLRGRALSGVAQFDAADAIYEALLEGCSQPTRLATYLLVLQAENRLAAGDLGVAEELATRGRAGDEGATDYFLRLRAAGVLAECALEEGEETRFKERIEALENEMLAASRWLARMALQSDPARLVRRLFGRQGNVYLHFAQIEALSQRGDPDRATGWDAEAVYLAMAIGGWSDRMVELLLVEAGVAARAGREDERLRLGTRALMELDANRYRLAAQSARTSWSRQLRRALSVTLDSALGAEKHALVAELLEFARVQALPSATAEAAGGLVLSTPPVVQLRGISRLARPGESERPAPVALEVAVARVAGPDAWWLSFWEADGWLYRAVVPPGSGEIWSGRMSIDAGSELARALDDLERALPLLQPGEDPASADFRIARSPLLADPDAERELSARLGSLLIPDPLLRAARACDERAQRLSLAVVPSPSLGYVPWGLLAMWRAEGRSDRLLELCDWVIAPSAALAVEAPGSAPAEPAPLALVVADTTSASELGPLEGARRQARALPPSVTVLGGPHWNSHPATVEAVERELRAAGPAITVAFMCHAVRGTAEEPSRGGVVMASAEGTELLGPVDIFEITRRGIAMPAQVLLQACDTSALSDAASGEWLTLAPALIAGGSREVVATLYPTPDLYVPDDPVIASAIAGTSLRDALVQSQRAGLARWEAGKASEPSHTPLSWAAYAPICVDPPAGGEHDRASVAEDGNVSARFIRLVSDAIDQCREGRAERLDSGYLLAAVLEDCEIAFWFDGGGDALKPLAFLWKLGPYACCRFLRFRDGGTCEIVADGGLRLKVSETMLSALSTARGIASRDGVLVEPEYVLQAALKQRSSAKRILRLLSVLSRRPVELTVRGIAHSLAMEISRGQRLPAEPNSVGDSDARRLAWAFGWSREAGATPPLS